MKEVRKIIKKLILGFFLVTFLLLTTIAIAGEKPTAVSVAAPSKCDCLKKDTDQNKPGLKSEVLTKDPSFDDPLLMKKCPYWRCFWSYDGHNWYRWCRCYMYPPNY
ncbi:MAG: hypothetical protein ABII96_01540 [Candidatus Zixiibacteriota bacterium]